VGKGGSYHHGDLRAALVETSLALIAERGVDALSVAEAARRTGVSPRAPYRHFATRLDLLSATATRAAELLAADLRTALAGDAASDPGEALAVTAEVYVRFVARHHAGFDLIYSEQLENHRDADLSAAGRAVMDILLPIAMDIAGHDPEAALDLLEKHSAAAHGYAVLLHLSGFLHRARTVGLDAIATGAAEVSRTLAAAAATAAAAR
jgi:AcrR family transcriptional regulator